MKKIIFITLLLLIMTACEKSSLEPTLTNSWPPDQWNDNLPEATEYDLVFQQVMDPSYTEYDFDIAGIDYSKYNHVELKRVRLKISDHMISLDNAARYTLPARTEVSSEFSFEGDFTGIPYKSVIYTLSEYRNKSGNQSPQRYIDFDYYYYSLEANYLWPGSSHYYILGTLYAGVELPPLSMYAFCLDTDNDHSGSGTLHQYYKNQTNQLTSEMHIEIDAEKNTIVPENAYMIKLDSIPGADWNNYQCAIICRCKIPAGYRYPRGIAVLAWVPGRHIRMFAGDGSLFNQTPVEMDGGVWITKSDSLYVGFCQIPECYGQLFKMNNDF